MIFAFDQFELDEARFELRRSGRGVAVQPKVLRLLLLLVANRHRSISDRELMDTLWPAEKVERASIKRAIMGARIALADRSQATIRTVRGHGYQFMLPVREQATDSRAPLTDGAPPRPSPTPAPGPAGRLSAPAFVGREPVLLELDASLERAFAGHGHCVLVLGEPGLGKTRILHEVSARASALGAQVWWGRCMEFDGAPAYWPWQQILRTATEGRNDSDLRDLLGPGAPDIAEGFPDLRPSLYEHLPVSPDIGSVQARFRLFDSTARFFVRASEERPLVLLLDDLQRADQPTLRFLLFLLGQLSRARLLVVGTARPSDPRDRDTQDRLSELSRESATRSIALTGLGRAEIERYLTLRTGFAAPAEIVTRLHEQTAGNPLFLEEILRSLRMNEVGAARHATAPWEGLAQVGQNLGLRGAIERHLSMVPEPCSTLLSSAAILGREFSLGLVAQLVELPPDDVMAQLQHATAAGILQRPRDDPRTSVARAPEGALRHRFTHALIRDVLYERMSALERARHHARVGRLLEARGAAFGDDVELAQVAEHFRLAAPTHDGGKALEYAQLAAERAMQRLAYEEAASHLGRALELLELAAPAPRQRMQLLLARGEALLFGGSPIEARATLLQTAALARGLQATDVLAEVARLLSRFPESGHVDEVRIELLREALAALPEADPRAPCLTAMLAKALSFANERPERVRLARSALALAFKLEAPLMRSEALQACHEALADPDSVDERNAIANALSALARQHPHPRITLSALTSHFQNCVEGGDVAGMERVVQELESLAQTARDWLIRWYEKIFRATCAFVAGRFELAERSAAEALQLGKSMGEESSYHQYCVQVNGIMRMQGRIVEAEAMARDISAKFPGIAGWRVWLASIHADMGQRDRARETLRQVMDRDLTMLRRDPYLLSALCPVAELCVRVGDEGSAKILYDVLLPYERLHGNVTFGGSSYGPISLQLARLAARMRELEVAEAHAARALAEAERMQSPTFTAIACITYAYVLGKSGDSLARPRARALVQRAEQIAGGAGMQGLVWACQALAQSLEA